MMAIRMPITRISTSMNSIDTSLPELSQLIEERLALLRTLAESLESSSLALAQNDAEAIARGAAHQAELCRQWSCLEAQLRREARRRAVPSSAGASGKSPEAERSAYLQAEWETLGARIRYLTRVHWSLLRHLQRSFAVLNRVVDSCAPTYTPDPGLLRPDIRLRAGE
jgi:chromosome segregation ATPase